MATKLCLLLLLATATSSFAAISAPLIGYYQDVNLAIADSMTSATQQCYIGNVPLQTGLSSFAQGPLNFDLAVGSGVHVLNLAPANSGYSFGMPVVQPPADGSPALKYNVTAPAAVTYDTSGASAGQSASISLPYQNSGGSPACTVTIVFNLVAPLTCAPNGGGTTVASTSFTYPTTTYYGTNNAYVQQLIQVNNQIFNVNINNVNINTNINQFICNCCFNSCNVIVENGTASVPPGQVLPPTMTVTPAPPSMGPTTGTGPTSGMGPSTGMGPTSGRGPSTSNMGPSSTNMGPSANSVTMRALPITASNTPGPGPGPGQSTSSSINPGRKMH